MRPLPSSTHRSCDRPAAPLFDPASREDQDLADTTLLSLLLTRTIAQQDIPQAVDALLQVFGSVAAVVAADAPELARVARLNATTITDLKLLRRLFTVLVRRAYVARTDSALAITASGFDPVNGRVIESLDGDVRRRLEDRRMAWEASGDTVIAWVHVLPHGEKMGLLAELTAISLDVREAKTVSIRRRARAEAAELAALCQADITLHWTPDAPFLQPHSKGLLTGIRWRPDARASGRFVLDRRERAGRREVNRSGSLAREIRHDRLTLDRRPDRSPEDPLA